MENRRMKRNHYVVGEQLPVGQVVVWVDGKWGPICTILSFWQFEPNK